MFPAISPDDTTKTYATQDDLHRIGLSPGLIRMGLAAQTGHLYRLVLNVYASALAVGNPVVYDLTTNQHSYEVTRPATAALNHLAGVACGAIPASGYGWVQVYGKAPSVTVDGTGTAIVAGDSLKAVNNTFNMVHDQATGTEPTYSNRVIAASATSAATTVAGFVSCLGF